jgi:hypothetical protein
MGALAGMDITDEQIPVLSKSWMKLRVKQRNAAPA